MRAVFNATRVVLSSKRYLTFFAVVILAALFLFIFIPVRTVPGNSFSFQLSLFTSGNYILFAFLASLISLVITMQVYIVARAKNTKTKAMSVGSGAVGGYAGVLGAVFATASCTWCVAAVFGFLGSGTVLFIAGHQIWAVSIAIVIMLLSLYFASRTVVKECDCAPHIKQ